MHMVTHAKVACDVMEQISPMNQRVKDLLIIGSILPDISEMGIGDEWCTHTEGPVFLKIVSPRYKYLALGTILHGEQPHGLDYYTHHGFYNIKKGYDTTRTGKGYIARRYKNIASILWGYRKSIRMLNGDEAIHFITELCFDHATAKVSPETIDDIATAFSRQSDNTPIIEFSDYFHVPARKIRRLNRIVRSPHTTKYLRNFTTAKGTARNVRDFLLLKALRDRSRSGFLHHLGAMARSSLGFLKLRDEKFVEMIKDCTEIIESDYEKFMHTTERQLSRMIREFL